MNEYSLNVDIDIDDDLGISAYDCLSDEEDNDDLCWYE